MLKRLVYALGKFYAVSPKNHFEGVEICRALQNRSISATLGKFSRSGDDPLQIVQEYQLISNSFTGSFASDSFYLSVKPPALNFSSELAAAVASVGLKNGHGIHFDSHEYADAERSLKMLQDVIDLSGPFCPMSGRWRFGVTLPSRWKRSVADAEWAAGKGLRVRLVKGEFKAPSTCETDPAKGFLEMIDLLAGRVPEIAAATHDLALAAESVARCRKTGSRVMLELLFGMPASEMMALSKEIGVPAGFYVPYGENLLIYAIRHFLANPRKLFRKDFFEAFASHASKLARITAF